MGVLRDTLCGAAFMVVLLFVLHLNVRVHKSECRSNQVDSAAQTTKTTTQPLSSSTTTTTTRSRSQARSISVQPQQMAMQRGIANGKGAAQTAVRVAALLKEGQDIRTGKQQQQSCYICFKHTHPLNAACNCTSGTTHHNVRTSITSVFPLIASTPFPSPNPPTVRSARQPFNKARRASRRSRPVRVKGHI